MIIIFILLLLCSPCLSYENPVKKDRYNEALLRQDDEVLIAKAKHPSRTYVEPVKEVKIIPLPKRDIEPIKITTTWEEEKE